MVIALILHCMCQISFYVYLKHALTFQVLKVLNDTVNHSKKKVQPMTLLFNIRPVSQMVGLRKRCGIEAVDSSGTVHRFLEGDDPLYFSTRLFDVKCSALCFLNALRLPQPATVYLHTDMEQEEDEGVRSLQNLSTHTITEVNHGHHLVVRKLSDDGNQLGPTFTVPLSADLKVCIYRTTPFESTWECAYINRLYYSIVGGCSKVEGLSIA